jgi:hemin uptake protein HemP
MPSTAPSTTAGNPPATDKHQLPTLRSKELLGMPGAVQIEHQGAIYTLRATSKGGLILTK